ncbi:MAG: LysR family transcriptional regulator [Pseudomonadota bacterium]
MQLNYKHLRYFWVVANEGSLAQASKTLFVSAPALSVQIQKLEEQLGQPLFERRNRQLVLTEAGRVALDYAETIFSTGSELLDRFANPETDTARKVRIGALSTLSRNFQLSFIRPLAAHDDVEISLRSASLPVLFEELDALNLDVLLINAPPPGEREPSWLAHLIDDQPISIVGSPNRVNRYGDLRDMLREEPLILPSANSSIRQNFDAWLDRERLAPRIAAEVDDMAMIRLLAREDIGLAVAPPIVVRDELDSGELIEAQHFDALHETFYAITPRRRFVNPLVRALIDEHARLTGHF